MQDPSPDSREPMPLPDAFIGRLSAQEPAVLSVDGPHPRAAALLGLAVESPLEEPVDAMPRRALQDLVSELAQRALSSGEDQILSPARVGAPGMPSGWVRCVVHPLVDRRVMVRLSRVAAPAPEPAHAPEPAAASSGEAALERLFRLSVDLQCIANMDGYFLRVNPAFTRTLGYSEAELLSRPFTDFIHPDDINATVEEVESLASGQPTLSFQNRYRHKDGHLVWLSWTSVPEPSEGLMFASARDITHDVAREEALRRTTQDLAHTNAELEQFAYVASHDLRAPLRDVDNLASWIDADVGDALPEGARRHLDLLRQRIQRMDRLLDDLLHYSRIGRDGHAPSDISLPVLVTDVFETLGSPPGFALVSTVPPLHLRLPRVPLEQVLRNLVDNAIKHHDRAQGRIEVTAEEDDEHVVILVRDDGPGIAEQYRERVFQIFQTLAPRDEVEGGGMGLSLVRKTVTVLGGTIEVRANVPRGCEMRLRLPREVSP